MGMSIDEHIGVIEDLKSTMSVCMPEPEKTEICTSLSEAMEIMHKYQEIEQIYSSWRTGDYKSSTECMEDIGKVVKGNDADKMPRVQILCFGL